MNELDFRIAYAERQFEWFKATFQLNLALGKLDVAQSYSEHMIGCNDELDRMLKEKHDPMKRF